jgi:ribosomal protein S18 acetylase RimI-like enzyme
MDYEAYLRSHLSGILGLCVAEGWPTFPADGERAHRVLTAPGVTTVVAVDRRVVAGFAQIQGDGEIQAHLSLLAVAAAYRRQGVASILLRTGLQWAGGSRLDLITETASDFYRALPHRPMAGFRVYP